MGLESASFVNDLVTTNPGATDAKAQGDDHLRLIKAALKASFPNSSRAFYIPTSVAAATGTVTIAAADQGKITPVSASGASRTVNLPANSGIPDGFECTIFKTDSSSNTVTIDADSSDTINGALTYVLTKQYQGVRLIWLTTFAAWIALPWINAIPYYSGGQDIPFSDIAPSGNAKRLLGAATATDFSEQTITAVLEWVSASLARGDLLMRGASAFDRFAPGTSGYLLKSNGAAADLSWTPGPARAVGEYTGNTQFTGTIPRDDTKPQISEGDAIVSATISLLNTSSLVRATLSGWASCAISVPILTVALFCDTVGNDAINVLEASADNDDPAINRYNISMVTSHAPATAGSVTYSVRAGSTTSYTFNGLSGSRLYGGSSRVSLLLEEIIV
jgi:hypothetical protein